MYIVRNEGSGSGSPVMGSKVKTHYEGKFLDGQVFRQLISERKAAGIPGRTGYCRLE